MSIITVSKLKKYFRVYNRSPGFFSALKSLFSRPTHTVKAVNDITFEINQGELVGFIGPNGAGKTTTLKCLSGLLFPSDGKIRVLGFNPYDRSREYLKQISLVMGQKNQLWWDLPAMDTFKLNKEIYDIEDKMFNDSLDELVTLLEVKDLVTRPVRQLSLGQRMKMELIAAFLHRPKVIFLDEPTIGLDVVMQKKIRDFIALYNRKYKVTVLLTSHYMTDVKELCKRIIIIDHGKIIFDGELEKLITKYADFKIVTVVFNQKVNSKDLTEFGSINYFEPGKVVLTIARNKVKDTATKLLEKYPVEDLNIEEADIEEVIRKVFTKKRS